MSIELKKNLKNLFAENEGEVLQVLTEVYENNTKAYNKVIQLSSRYNRYNEHQHSNTLSTSELNLEISKIETAVIYLIDQITEKEAAAYQLKNAIFQRILVVCKSPEREPEMRRLFPERFFKGVEYDISGQTRPAESVNQFDLLVFDNYPPGEQEDQHELLRYYLDKTEPLLLYFGTLTLRWLGDDYPEKAYFANSVFSIHSRIDEMIRYLKYTR